MARELDYDSAYDVAILFRLIPDFPRDQKIVEDMAKLLIDLCRGRIMAGRLWSGKDQATWLYESIRDNWEKWRGVTALRAVFLEQFGRGQTDAQRCPLCGDAGVWFRNGRYEMCGCRIGKLLHPSIAAELNTPLNEGPPAVLLDADQRKDWRQLVPVLDQALQDEPGGGVTRAEVDQAIAKPITQEDIDRERRLRREQAEKKQLAARAEGSEKETEDDGVEEGDPWLN